MPFESSFFKNKTVFLSSVISSIVTIACAYFIFVVDSKKVDVDYGDLNLRNCQELFEGLKKEIVSLKVELNELRMENQDLKLVKMLSSQNSILYSNAIDQLPFPYWVKNMDGTMMRINVAYEKMFLLPRGLNRFSYINNKDSSVWPVEVAAQFKESDNKVISSKQMMKFKENVIINSALKEVEVYKFPIYLDDMIIGVGGIVLIK